jgi:hypothetical protein
MYLLQQHWTGEMYAFADSFDQIWDRVFEAQDSVGYGPSWERLEWKTRAWLSAPENLEGDIRAISRRGR